MWTGTVETDQPQYRFVVDKEKAALNGVTAEQVAATLQLALSRDGGRAAPPTAGEGRCVYSASACPGSSVRASKTSKRSRLLGPRGNLVPLASSCGGAADRREESIYRKNLMPVVYVTGDVAGQDESPVYALLKMERPWISCNFPKAIVWNDMSPISPSPPNRFAMKWNGEMAYHL